MEAKSLIRAGQATSTNTSLTSRVEKEVLRYASILQSNGVIAMHKVDGYQQQCDVVKEKPSADQDPQLKGNEASDLSHFCRSPVTFWAHGQGRYGDRRSGREIVQPLHTCSNVMHQCRATFWFHKRSKSSDDFWNLVSHFLKVRFLMKGIWWKCCLSEVRLYYR